MNKPTLIHMAVIENGYLRMMSGRALVDCELYALMKDGQQMSPDKFLQEVKEELAREYRKELDKLSERNYHLRKLLNSFGKDA